MSFPQMPFSFMRSRRFLRGDVAIAFGGLDVRADGAIVQSLQGEAIIDFGGLDVRADGVIVQRLEGGLAIEFGGLDVRADGLIARLLQGDAAIEFGGLDVRADFTASLWTPSAIARELELDDSDASTIISSGTLVSQWRDKSGNSRHATTPNNFPIYNGDSITFNNSRLSIPVSAVANLKNCTIVAVLQGVNPSTSPSAGLININVADNPEIRIFIGTRKVRAYWNNGYALSDQAGISDIPTVLTIVSIEFSTSGGNIQVKFRTNGGVPIIASNADTWITSFSEFTLGRYDSINQYQNGVIRDLIIFETNDTNREKAEGHFAFKRGLAANLPSNHPYKSAAPTV